jgi:hypothetical protein
MNQYLDAQNLDTHKIVYAVDFNFPKDGVKKQTLEEFLNENHDEIETSWKIEKCSAGGTGSTTYALREANQLGKTVLLPFVFSEEKEAEKFRLYLIFSAFFEEDTYIKYYSTHKEAEAALFDYVNCSDES